MPSRVLFVASIGTTLRLFVAPLARSLRAAGIESIAAAGGLDDDLADFDRSYRLPPFRRGSAKAVVAAYRDLRAVVDREKPSLLHLHSPPALILGRLMARSRRIPSIAVAHGSFLEPKGPRSLIYAAFESALARLSAATVTENEEDAEFYRRHCRAGTVSVAPVGGIGIDLTRIEAARHAPKVVGPSPSIVVLGRLTPEKNLDVIVRAFAKLRTVHASAGLTFVGSALPGDRVWTVPSGPGVAHLKWLDDPYPIIAGADLMVLASRREGFSMSAAEALLLGVPVVAVTNRGVREIQRHDAKGLVVVSNSWEQLGQAMEACLNQTSTFEQDPQLAQRWSQTSAIAFHRDVVMRELACAADC